MRLLIDTHALIWFCEAMVEKLTIVTCDPHFLPYGVPLLW